MTVLPKILYHATTDDVAAKIVNEGLKPHPIFGSFLAEKAMDAVKFAWHHKGSKPKNWEEILNIHSTNDLDNMLAGGGDQIEVPASTWHNKIIVLAINTQLLVQSRFEISHDHDPAFWQTTGECYTYERKIPTSALMIYKEFELKEGKLIL
jgi:hypothetical protein